MKIVLHRYCEKCGKEMNKFQIYLGFDRYTGKNKKYIRFICPELDWNKMLEHPDFSIDGERFMGHYYFVEKDPNE